jgi:hypothetical protein
MFENVFLTIMSQNDAIVNIWLQKIVLKNINVKM